MTLIVQKVLLSQSGKKNQGLVSQGRIEFPPTEKKQSADVFVSSVAFQGAKIEPQFCTSKLFAEFKTFFKGKGPESESGAVTAVVKSEGAKSNEVVAPVESVQESQKNGSAESAPPSFNPTEIYYKGQILSPYKY